MPITVDNTLNAIGDTVIFTTIPIFNLQTLAAYVPTITGITGTRTLQTQFCFSLDGIVYTDWADISTIVTAVNVELPAQQVLYIQLKYTRTGTDATGSIVIVSIDLTGTYISTAGNYPVGMNSIYSDLVYDNVDVFNNMVNLVQKIYSEGILPVYIDRNDKANDIHNDEDFIAFWSSIAQFFSIFYVDAVKFTIVYWRLDLLEEWLTQKNVIFAPGSSIVLLQHLAKNYYDEMRQRGTIEIFREENYQYPMGNRNVYVFPVGFVQSQANPIIINDQLYNEINQLPFGWTWSGNTLYAPDINYYAVQYVNWVVPPVITGYFDYSVICGEPRITILPTSVLTPTLESGVFRKHDGEYLRLIAYSKDYDEFMFLLRQVQNRGWNLGNSSPLYRGLRHIKNNTIIKGYETYSEEVYDLARYPFSPIFFGMTSRPKAPFAPYSMQQYLVPAPLTNIAGHASIVNEPCPPYPYTLKNAMRIFPANRFGFIDVPTSKPWMIRADPTITYEISFWFKQSIATPMIDLSINCFNKWYAPVNTYDIAGGAVQNNFLNGSTEMASNDTTRWYFAQYFIYAEQTPLLPFSTPPLCPLNIGRNLIFDVNSANIIINLAITNTGSGYVDIFDFKIRPASTPYSMGFIQNGDIMEIWRKNNNNKYGEDNIDTIAKNYLLNYNLALASIPLPQS